MKIESRHELILFIAIMLSVPFLAAGFIGLEILLNREFWTHNRRGLVIFALIAVLVFAPLGLYSVAHPGEFIERPGTVTVASSGLAKLADNAVKVAGMYDLAIRACRHGMKSVCEWRRIGLC